MHWLATFGLNYGLFLAKAATLVAAIAIVVIVLTSSAISLRREKNRRLVVERVNDRLERMADTLSDALLNDAEKKARAKQRKKETKQKQKAEKLGKKHPPQRLFVLDFDGDIRASAVDGLRESINALLQVAESDDEVLLRLESGGGMVHSYGLAASQLVRLRDAGIRLTVAVDQVAASGGYMMACVGDRIVAAPFAIIGSIGVVAQLPNFHRWLSDKHIDFEMHTAGDYKRTLTVFGENTEAGREKFREELEDTHGLFKTFVARHRPDLDIDSVATGEHWYGSQALEKGLVDDIATSDAVMLGAARDGRDVFTIATHTPQGLIARLTGQTSRVLAKTLHEQGLTRAEIGRSTH
ncbi:protease SohB [Salinisphaera hydrothermalis]|uniref:Inner membrane peptidase n=1 Tax=Salinisphaera hydrothermalis (strain C41B8) TaxID=1304275 RepID=A0A084IKY0_SALHC|nr:protease SohB [Salinisphaera hydrothermalis]KEZ77364.1 inner membrane peptidase [Salinisphaera hydrothermalis C41B8]